MIIPVLAAVSSTLKVNLLSRPRASYHAVDATASTTELHLCFLGQETSTLLPFDKDLGFEVIFSSQ